MNKKIFLIGGMIFLILAVTAGSIKNEYILIEINYENGKFYLVNETLEKGNYPSIEHEINSDYRFELVSDKGEVLFTGYVEPNLVFTDGLSKEKNNKDFEGGVVELNQSNFFIIAPNIKKSDKIKIFKEDNKVFEAKIDFQEPTSCRLR
jgi:hypothetical protein